MNGAAPQTLAAFAQAVPGSDVTFVMKPVRLADGRTLWFGETEVTWDAYDVFRNRLDLPPAERIAPGPDTQLRESATRPDAIARPSPPYGDPARGFGRTGMPAIGVTHHAAEQYCRWLSQKTGRRYRLPTAAEWAECCRTGGTNLPRDVGDVRASAARSGCGAPGVVNDASRAPPITPGAPHPDPQAPSRPSINDYAWHFDNANEQPQGVAAKLPNAHGLYDMLGNVAEWCTIADGKGTTSGGSYLTDAADLRCDLIEPQTPAWNQSDGSFPKSKWWLSDAPFVGFRVVCEPQAASMPLRLCGHSVAAEGRAKPSLSPW